MGKISCQDLWFSKPKLCFCVSLPFYDVVFGVFTFSPHQEISQDNLIFLFAIFISISQLSIFWLLRLPISFTFFFFPEQTSLSIYFLPALFWGWYLFSALIFISLWPQKWSRLLKFIFWKSKYLLGAGIVSVCGQGGNKNAWFCFLYPAKLIKNIKWAINSINFRV